MLLLCLELLLAVRGYVNGSNVNRDLICACRTVGANCGEEGDRVLVTVSM